MTSIKDSEAFVKELTIRVDDQLATAIRTLAESEGLSFNEAATRLLRRGAGIEEPRSQARVGDTLDHLAGTWSEDEAWDFLESISACDSVDEAFWR